MKEYQYILLDWDGNLAKTLHLWIDALEAVLHERSIVLERQTLVMAASGVTAFLTEQLQLSQDESEAIARDAGEIVRQRLPTLELYPDALEILGDLKDADKKLALITSSVRSLVEPTLEKYSMQHFFDAIVCGDEVEQRKPHPEPLHKALDLLGGNQDEAIMVGDTDKDILAARNASIDSILFFPVEHQEFYSLEILAGHQPTYVVSDFWDVAKIAKGLHK